MATLYVVGTPIGNLKDTTLRAIEVLKSVDVVACEDTRVTGKLLHHFGISKPMMSLNARNEKRKVGEVVSMLKGGKSVALVSDAGTPAISDPGSFLVSRVREECEEEVTIVSIPGTSAVTAALSISGLPSSDFLFLGFLPHKKGRETLMKEIAKSKRTVVFYESPHRVLAMLKKLEVHIGNRRRIVVCRELTKVFEQCVGGSFDEVRGYFERHPDKIRGEFVVMVSPVTFHL